MLPRLIGKARAAEMMLLGERIGAQKAESWGLIHKCVSDDTLMDEARALAARLAGGPTLALGQMRENLMRALQSDRSEEHTSELQSLMRISYAGFCLKNKYNKHLNSLFM